MRSAGRADGVRMIQVALFLLHAAFDAAVLLEPAFRFKPRARGGATRPRVFVRASGGFAPDRAPRRVGLHLRSGLALRPSRRDRVYRRSVPRSHSVAASSRRLGDRQGAPPAASPERLSEWKTRNRPAAHARSSAGASRRAVRPGIRGCRPMRFAGPIRGAAPRRRPMGPIRTHRSHESYGPTGSNRRLRDAPQPFRHPHRLRATAAARSPPGRRRPR